MELLKDTKIEVRAKQLPSMNDPLMQEVREIAQATKREQKEGKKAFQEGRFQEAVELFRQAVELHPYNPVAHSQYIEVLITLKEWSKAMAAVEHSLTSFPAYPQLLFQKGMILSQMGQIESAIEFANEQLLRDPELKRLHDLLGSLYTKRAQYAKANSHYSLLSQLDQANEGARVRIVTTLMLGGRYGEAFEEVERQLLSFPESVGLSQLKIRLLAVSPIAATRNPERALQLAEAAIARRKGPFLFETLAMALASNRRFKDAEAVVGDLTTRLESLINQSTGPRKAMLEKNRQRMMKRKAEYQKEQFTLPLFDANERLPQMASDTKEKMARDLSSSQ